MPKEKEEKNQTLAFEFILLGFSFDLTTNIALFMLFFIAYLITCIANVLVIVIIIINRHLHTPMYFFLCNLSFLDLFYSSNALPKFLIDIFSNERIISLGACMFQVYSSLSLGVVECLLLALMAYDRYVAICRPLYYTVLMSWKACYQLSVMIWSLSFIIVAVPSVSIPISFCNPNTINHFMCEAIAVIKLACTSSFLTESIFISSFIFILLPFILIFVSYICIISSVLKIDSVGRDKAFATCTSHLTVVILYYITAMIMYSGSSSYYLSNKQKYISVMYIIITPMLNPLIYSIKNREVKEGFRKLVAKSMQRES